MFNHSFIFLALISFSIVSNAAAIPMDADQAVIGTTPNAVLHKEVAAAQGGNSDKDVTESLVNEAVDSCSADALCTNTDTSLAKHNPPAVSDWFAVQDDDSVLQPVAALLLMIGLIVFFLSRKSTSTK
jgi:hypothetical protein